MQPYFRPVEGVYTQHELHKFTHSLTILTRHQTSQVCERSLAQNNWLAGVLEQQTETDKMIVCQVGGQGAGLSKGKAQVYCHNSLEH